MVESHEREGHGGRGDRVRKRIAPRGDRVQPLDVAGGGRGDC